MTGATGDVMEQVIWLAVMAALFIGLLVWMVRAQDGGNE